MSKILCIDGKYYDFGTKNQSFLLTAQELKTLGIKNYYFMLEVKYPQMGVQDIDPYDPDITPENIGRIHVECKANPWFFFREVAKIPVRGAGNLDPILSRASCAAVWCFLHSIDFLLNQPRQTHKTTWIELITTYVFIYELRNATIPFMHIRESRCIDNAEILRDYITALPPYMNPWYGRNKLPGLKSLKYDEHGTNITILSAADSEVKAKDKMRGMTLFVGFVDEWEYIPYIDQVISGATPAIISGRDIARQTGVRTCMMYASTPGDLETDTGKAAQRMIDKTPPFSEQMYDMTDQEIDEMFSGMSIDVGDDKVPVTMLYIEFNHVQLRKNNKWLREQYLEAERTGELAEYRRGVLLQRFRGANGSLFRQSDIDYIQEHTRQPDYDIFIMKKFHLYVYKHEIQNIDLTSSTPYFDINIPYLVGIDIASGGDGDNTTLCIVHPYTLEVVGELISPYIGLLDLMRIITTVAKLIPKCVFCPETNSIGKALVDFVQETNLEHRFYHDPKLDISKNPITMNNNDATTSLRIKAVNKGYIGTYVSPGVREQMFKLLIRYVKDYRHLINTKYLVKDIVNLVKHKNGKIAAANGEHDDMVMAYNHVIYVLSYGHDLTRFGIDKRLCVFEKVNDVLKEYDEHENETIVDNMKPYDQPTMYEEQLLHDLTNNGATFNNVTGIDEYGYTRKQYNRNGGMETNNLATLSSNDVAYFMELNSYGI